MGDLMPPVNGTDQRLDLLLGELRAIRALLTPAEPVELKAELDTIELREPAGPERSRRTANAVADVLVREIALAQAGPSAVEKRKRR